jgi:hypothetical protein
MITINLSTPTIENTKDNMHSVTVYINVRETRRSKQEWPILTIRFIKDISGAHRKYCKCKFYPSQMSMNHFRRLFLSSIIEKTFTGLYIWVTRRVSYKKQKVLAIHQHMGSRDQYIKSSILAWVKSDSKFGCFSTKHAAISTKNKDFSKARVLV